MKTILLATDYSGTANNAMKYAVELAKTARAKLVLFHAYSVPVPVTEVQVIMPVAISQLETEHKKKMKKLESRVIKLSGEKVKTESAIGSGMPVEEILKAARTKKADVIVMGIKGAGKLSQALIGSTATLLMKKSSVPVLIIPQRAKFNKAGKIVLAYDYRKSIKKDVIKKIKEFAAIFRAEVQVLNVVRLFEEPGYKKAHELVKLKSALRGIKHNFYFPASENTTDEINSFIKKQKAGMLVMLPHKHTMLDTLLYYTSDTKRMAFQTQVPLLSFHD